MYTLGYRFKPWPGAKAIADGPSILDYVRKTAAEYDVEDKIRFNHKVVGAEWSTADARWTVEAERTDTGDTVRLTCNFMLMCPGYYSYDNPYTPDFPGSERFKGTIVHPQHWSDDIDYEGKRVVVIGSGATAVTLVPAMAERAEHVTMLQRSPTYIVTLPAVDPVARLVRKLLPAKWAYALIRWKNVLVTSAFYQLSRRRPRLIKRFIREGVKRQLPADYDMKTHFRPRYDPWDQRVCLVPDGDLFTAIRQQRASIVTDRIESFTERGIKLESGDELEADLIITATGLNLLPLGGAELRVDGRDVAIPETMGYKGMMLSGVPNMAVGARLYKRLLDAEVRPHARVRLPPSQPHGRARLSSMHAGAQRPDRHPRADDRLHLGLCPACDPHVPEARVEGPLAPPSELRARHRLASLRRHRGRSDGLLESRARPHTRGTGRGLVIEAIFSSASS